MTPTAYTIARWRVAPGQEEAFRTAWVELVEALTRLARPPLCGTLLQHRTDPTLFYSFGPWDDAEDIDQMCHDPAGQDAFLKVAALCVDAEPGVFRLVEKIECRPDRAERARKRTRRGLRRSLVDPARERRPHDDEA